METGMDFTKIKKYPAYKDSGVQWIEDVPSHWELKKFKRVFYEIKKRSNVELNCGSISFGNVVYKDDEKIPISTKKSYQVVLKGDFLVNPLNLNYDLISLRIALSEINVVVSSGYIVLNNSVNLDKNYFKYFLHRFDVAYMKLLGSGVRQTLNYNDIANCELIFPPLEEQTAIAQFLDRKTALIDQAISIKQKQIDLLNERRQILIHKAVTCGLNPNVKMKDSGVEWIGEIPEHWMIVKLKFVSEFINDGTHGSYPRVEIGYRLLSVRNMIDDKFVFREDDSRISEKHFKEISSKFQINKGDIQLAIVGATLGKVAIVNEYDELFVTQRSVCTIRVNKDLYSNAYLFYFIKSPAFQKYLWLNAEFSAQPGVYLGTIQNSSLPFPPFKEQKSIVNYLTDTSLKFENLISLKEQEIEKLKEYKATLINSAVTGKIKVS
jgi:type I restriction enzyme S subunit